MGGSSVTSAKPAASTEAPAWLHAISVPLTPVSSGMPRSLMGRMQASSRRGSCMITTICKQGVSGSSPLSSTRQNTRNMITSRTVRAISPASPSRCGHRWASKTDGHRWAALQTAVDDPPSATDQMFSFAPHAVQTVPASSGGGWVRIIRCSAPVSISSISQMGACLSAGVAYRVPGGSSHLGRGPRYGHAVAPAPRYPWNVEARQDDRHVSQAGARSPCHCRAINTGSPRYATVTSGQLPPQLRPTAAG
jgi:hypothetical protein